MAGSNQAVDRFLLHPIASEPFDLQLRSSSFSPVGRAANTSMGFCLPCLLDSCFAAILLQLRSRQVTKPCCDSAASGVGSGTGGVWRSLQLVHPKQTDPIRSECREHSWKPSRADLPPRPSHIPPHFTFETSSSGSHSLPPSPSPRSSLCF